MVRLIIPLIFPFSQAEFFCLKFECKGRDVFLQLPEAIHLEWKARLASGGIPF